jgi:hypothetical protein
MIMIYSIRAVGKYDVNGCKDSVKLPIYKYPVSGVDASHREDCLI